MKKLLPFLILFFIFCFYNESALAETSIPFSFTYENGETLRGSLSTSSDNAYFAIVRLTNLDRPMVTCVDRTTHVDLPFSYNFGSYGSGSVSGYGVEIPNTNWSSDLSYSNLQAFEGYDDVMPYYEAGGFPAICVYGSRLNPIVQRQIFRASTSTSFVYLIAVDYGSRIYGISDSGGTVSFSYWRYDVGWDPLYSTSNVFGGTINDYQRALREPQNYIFYSSLPVFLSQQDALDYFGSSGGSLNESCSFDYSYLYHMRNPIDVYDFTTLKSPFYCYVVFGGNNFDYADLTIVGSADSTYISHVPNNYSFSTSQYFSNDNDALTVVLTPRRNNGDYGVSSQFTVSNRENSTTALMNDVANTADRLTRTFKKIFVKDEPSVPDSPLVPVELPVNEINRTEKRDVVYNSTNNINLENITNRGDSTIYFSPIYENPVGDDGEPLITEEQFIDYITNNYGDDVKTENTNWDFSTNINIDIGDVDLTSFDSSKKYVTDAFDEATSYLNNNIGILEAFHFDGIGALVIGGVAVLLVAFVVLIILKIVGIIL